MEYENKSDKRLVSRTMGSKNISGPDHRHAVSFLSYGIGVQIVSIWILEVHSLSMSFLVSWDAWMDRSEKQKNP